MKIIKETIVKNYNLLLKKGMNLGSEGNISIKFKEKIFLTPSGIDIKNLKTENISIIDFEGNVKNIGNLVDVKITTSNQNTLFGEIVKSMKAA